MGLAAAETENPRKTLPTATKQVFWRVVSEFLHLQQSVAEFCTSARVQTFFYVISLLLVGFLVPYNDPDLLNGSGSTTSPFVIAIKHAQIKGMYH